MTFVVLLVAMLACFSGLAYAEEPAGDSMAGDAQAVEQTAEEGVVESAADETAVPEAADESAADDAEPVVSDAGTQEETLPAGDDASADVLPDNGEDADPAVTEVAQDVTGEEAAGDPEAPASDDESADNATPVVEAAPAAAAATAASTVASTPVAAPKKTAKKAPEANPIKAGWYSLTTILKTSLRVEVRNSGSKTGTKLLLKKNGATTGQAFKLVKYGNYWRLKSGVGFKTRVTMDKSGNVYLSTKGGTSTLFKLVANADGSYRLVNVKYKKALTIEGGTAKKGAYLIGAKSSAKNKAQAFNLVTRKGILNEGVYSMRTWLGSKYAVAPKKSSLAVGKTAALVKYGAKVPQKWQVSIVPGKVNIYTIECIATGYRLTGASGTASLQKVNNQKNQMWKVIGTNGQVMLKNMATKQVLQVNGTKAKKNALVICAKSTKDDNQRFTMKYANVMGSGYYEFDSAANAKLALEVKGSSESSGATVQVATDSNGLNQRWYYDKSSKTLSNVNSGLVLTVKDGNASSGVAIVQAKASGEKTQKWKFQYMGGGKFRLVSAANEGLALNASGTKSGANAKLAKVSTSTKQGWTVREQKASVTTTKQLKMTLDQMIKWQKAGNPYISSYSAAQLRNVLDPAKCSKYQFLDLRKSAGVSAKQLDAFINTYGSKGKLKGLGVAFVSAGKTYKVNEVYLLAHAILESGWGSSTLANGYKYSGGYIDGKKYKAGTYYNFYGIGAYDSSPLSGGRKLAIINGWNSPSKAVTGAAKWIANNYIYASSYPQYTLYNMKWDTDRSSATKAYGWHQYATSPDWAKSIASLIESCFKLTGATGSMSFVKPVYK